MKAIMHVDKGDNVKGFTIEASVLETLILNSALRYYFENADEHMEADRLIAKQMHDILIDAEERTD